MPTYASVRYLISRVSSHLSSNATSVWLRNFIRGVTKTYCYKNLAIQMSFIVGVTACCVAGLFFGSRFVAIRGHDAGDGIFSQWVSSIAVLCVGFADFWYQGFPGFYPLAMLGGAFWIIANSTAIPIIRVIGMAVGLLIWNSSKCITGWVTGRLGMFGMKPNTPASETINYIGLIMIILGAVMFSFIKNESSGSEEIRVESKNEMRNNNAYEANTLSTDGDESFKATISLNTKKFLSDGMKRVFSVVVAVIAGLFYGVTFVPVIYMVDNRDLYPDYPDDGFYYVFSYFFGIFLTATALFIVYSLYKRNRPFMPPDIVLPSFLGGVLWAAGQTSFFIANQHLSQAIAFPIITGLPGCVASLWSIFYFKEIKGKLNLFVFSTALMITIAGAVLVGLSKEVHI